ncbi:MAG: patatin-like phospholipase family protein [Gammaproteobacteria bacterium]|nr:patatin-like phospholipase family protein [Gammaproteobacteria bacterium]
MKRIGIALGGGGVRGLAHVPVLEALDELGVRPVRIAGTSIGAIVGAAYASGLSGREMRSLCMRHIVARGDRLSDLLDKRAQLRLWLNAFGLERGRGGLLSAERMFGYLFEGLRVRTFEALGIPLRVVAADFWSAQQVVFDTGELLPALRASSAFPGVFAPARVDGRVLVDGGMVNNVPYDLLGDDCDVVIAVNVAKHREPEREATPGLIDAMVGAFDIMHEADMARRLERAPPDLYVHPRISRIAAFDFTAVEDVLDQARPAVERFKAQLATRLEA